jgi:hypothetical protein
VHVEPTGPDGVAAWVGHAHPPAPGQQGSEDADRGAQPPYQVVVGLGARLIGSVDHQIPCWVSVRQDRAAEVERKGRELVNDFESGGSGCDYECAARGTPSCKSGRCGITE